MIKQIRNLVIRTADINYLGRSKLILLFSITSLISNIISPVAVSYYYYISEVGVVRAQEVPESSASVDSTKEEVVEVVEEKVEKAPAVEVVEEQSEVTEEETVVEDGLVEDGTEEQGSTEEVTEELNPEEQPDILEDGITDFKPLDTSSEENNTTEPEKGTKCLEDKAPIMESVADDWNINESEGLAETKEKVVIGVKYTFPLEEKVSVTFKCLPADENLRSTLKIQKIKVEELNLPESISTLGEYAYDITTAMKDGEFEYEISLPTSEEESEEVGISYIEKTVDEVKSSKELKAEDVKQIEKNVEKSGDLVKASGIDHFSVYFVTGRGDKFKCSAVKYKLEGLVKDGNYTTGNLCQGPGACWAEGEDVPARLTIEGLVKYRNYSVVIQHDYKRYGTVGYENFNSPDSKNNSAANISLSSPEVKPCHHNGSVSCKTYTLSFKTLENDVQLDWLAKLGPDAGDWPGSSLHFRLIDGVCGQNVGNKEVPINPDNIKKVEFGSISGRVFEDKDIDEDYGWGDSALHAWKVFIDEDGDKHWDHGEDYEYTDGDGKYKFENLTPNKTYSVCEVIKDEWYQTTPGSRWHPQCYSIDLKPGWEVKDKDFGNFEYGFIEGYKWNDLDGDGVWEDGEPALEGWKITLDGSEGYWREDVTDEDGRYSFTHIAYPGIYKVREVQKQGWTQTAPEHSKYILNIKSGSDFLDKNFGNHGALSISGYKYKATDLKGHVDESKPTIPDWKIYLYKCEDDQEVVLQSNPEPEVSILGSEDRKRCVKVAETLTDSEGAYSFNNLEPGKYKVKEEQKSDYKVVKPKSGVHFVYLYKWSRKGIDFYNMPLTPELEITKSNNWNNSNPLKPGDIVEYTLKVKVKKAPLNELVVTDAPPEGFTYQNGTGMAWVNSGEYGVDPHYASPGKWVFNELQAGDEIEMKYRAVISSGVGSGLHSDLAWAVGTTGSGNTVLAIAGEEGNIDDDNFVGTAVEVSNDPEPEEAQAKTKIEEVEEGEVLGASTTLPATGARDIWIATVVILFALGVGLIVYGILRSLGFKKSIRIRINLPVFKKPDFGKWFRVAKAKARKINPLRLIRKLRNPALGLVLFALISLFAGKAYASSHMVRISQPSSPASQPFSVTFVALSTEDKAMTARCYYRYEGGSWVKAGSDVSIKAGGDSESCDYTEKTLNKSGEYSFKVEVSVIGDWATSNIVKVDYDAEGPDTPKYIEKDKKGSCKYEVTFRTANDNETVRAEVYKSTEKKYTANDSTRIKTVNIGSDEKYTFVDEFYGSECEKTYYYSVRAFDSTGNASGVRAEEIEETITTETEAETEEEEVSAAIVVTDSKLTGEGGESEEDVEVVAKEDETGTIGQETEGDVLGKAKVEGLSSKIVRSPAAWGVLGLIIAGATSGYVIRKTRKTKKTKINF